jgi:formylglycine-generating enzyme required for sulfatase activity
MKRILAKRFSMMEVAGLVSVLLVGIGLYAWAATTVPNTFTAGTIAKASEVNANFQAVTDAINHVTCAGNSANDIMVPVGPLCVDKYEASVWSNADGTGTHFGSSAAPFSLTDYPGTFPGNGNWTTPVYAVSKAGVLPSTSITWFQAQQACALSGKRLLTNAEWQMAAAGTPDPGSDNGSTDCAVNGNPDDTGSRSSCISKWGVNDMVGNVWEFVGDWMQGSTNPWAPTVGGGTATSATYGNDFVAGTNPAILVGGGQNFPGALVRGGMWTNGTGAGVFAVSTFVMPTAAGTDTGFRCAR